jgi:cobalamin synthase
MRDSRNGSYATMGGCFWVVAKCAAIAKLGELAGGLIRARVRVRARLG